MKAKEIIPEVRRPDRENIPYGYGSGAPVGGGIPTGRIEPTLGQTGSQAVAAAAAAARSARQAQATQAAQSQMAAKPPAAAAPTTSDVMFGKQSAWPGRGPETIDQRIARELTRDQIPTRYTQTPSGQTGALGTATTVAPGARINSGSPNQPLNPPGQNVWRSGQTGAPMRSPGRDRAMTHAELRKYLEPPPAPGEKYAWPGAIGAAAAIGTGLHYGSRTGGDKGDKPASGQSTPQAPARNPNMTQQMQDRLGIPLNSQGRTASGATPAQTPTATTTPPAARPAGPQQGVVGSELARLSGGEFASRADRLNQARVDAILGSGYKAGTAAANRALRDYYKANPPMSDEQRQELTQRIFNQSMERLRQQAADAKVTVRPAGSDKSTETVPEDNNELTRLMKLSGQR
jgi:hypothetical protein